MKSQPCEEARGDQTSCLVFPFPPEIPGGRELKPAFLQPIPAVQQIPGFCEPECSASSLLRTALCPPGGAGGKERALGQTEASGSDLVQLWLEIPARLHAVSSRFLTSPNFSFLIYKMGPLIHLTDGLWVTRLSQGAWGCSKY